MTTSRLFTLVLAVAACLALAACETSEGGGGDTPHETLAEIGPDGAADVLPEALAETVPDAGPEVAPEATIEGAEAVADPEGDALAEATPETVAETVSETVSETGETEVTPGPGALTLDPASLQFGSLPIGSYRPMISGYDPVARTCVSLIWMYDNPWSGGFCDAFPESMPYAVVTPDTDGPCGQWEYGGDWVITDLQGCADWAEFGAGHLDLADFTATLSASEAGQGAPTFTVTVDNRAEYAPPPVTLGLRYSTDIPEDVWIQSGDAYGLPGWLRVTRDGVPLVLFDRCDVPVCGEGSGVCGVAFQTVTNLTNTSYGGDAFLTWDGLHRVEDPVDLCWKREVAPPGDYELEACFGWTTEETDAGTVVKNPSCVKQPFSLPADAWIVMAAMGG